MRVGARTPILPQSEKALPGDPNLFKNPYRRELF
jgi:hypothetical protein